MDTHTRLLNPTHRPKRPTNNDATNNPSTGTTTSPRVINKIMGNSNNATHANIQITKTTTIVIATTHTTTMPATVATTTMATIASTTKATTPVCDKNIHIIGTHATSTVVSVIKRRIQSRP